MLTIHFWATASEEADLVDATEVTSATAWLNCRLGISPTDGASAVLQGERRTTCRPQTVERAPFCLYARNTLDNVNRGVVAHRQRQIDDAPSAGIGRRGKAYLGGARVTVGRDAVPGNVWSLGVERRPG